MSEYRIRVTTVDQKVGIFQVPRTKTVLELKELIAVTFEAPADRLKLIHAGRVLRNETPLEEILHDATDLVTFHLVIAVFNSTSTTLPSATSSSVPQSRTSELSSTNSIPTPRITSLNPEELSRRERAQRLLQTYNSFHGSGLGGLFPNIHRELESHGFSLPTHEQSSPVAESLDNSVSSALSPHLETLRRRNLSIHHQHIQAHEMAQESLETRNPGNISSSSAPLASDQSPTVSSNHIHASGNLALGSNLGLNPRSPNSFSSPLDNPALHTVDSTNVNGSLSPLSNSSSVNQVHQNETHGSTISVPNTNLSQMGPSHSSSVPSNLSPNPAQNENPSTTSIPSINNQPFPSGLSASNSNFASSSFIPQSVPQLLPIYYQTIFYNGNYYLQQLPSASPPTMFRDHSFAPLVSPSIVSPYGVLENEETGECAFLFSPNASQPHFQPRAPAFGIPRNVRSLFTLPFFHTIRNIERHFRLFIRLALFCVLTTYNVSLSQTILLTSIMSVVFLLQTGALAPFINDNPLIQSGMRHIRNLQDEYRRRRNRTAQRVVEIPNETQTEDEQDGTNTPDNRADAEERELTRSQRIYRTVVRTIVAFALSFVPRA